MTETLSQNLKLPYLAASQAQKHVTHNEAIQALDVIVQLSVLSRNLDTPPDDPTNGDQYIIGPNPNGLWHKRSNEIAAFQEGQWIFYPPKIGWLSWVIEENAAYIWNGEFWTQLQSSEQDTDNPSDDTLPVIGVNTIADTINKLSVKSDAILFSHDDVTPGSGDMRVFINKSDQKDTAATIYQSGFSAHSEIGLTGNNDLQIKTSADGSHWNTSLIIDAVTGSVNFPRGVRHRPTQQLAHSTLFIPDGGGDGISSIWRCDTLRSSTPRQSLIENIDGDRLILSANEAGTYIDSRGRMNGVSLIRIWNMSKTPIQQAWIKAYISDNTLQMHNPENIKDWSKNETIQLVDPDNPTNLFAVDISPMMQKVFGTVFPQHGVVLKTLAIGVKSRASLVASPTGNLGSNFTTRSLNTGSAVGRQIMINSSIPSPISNSNLVFFRETGQTNDIRICLATVTALLI